MLWPIFAIFALLDILAIAGFVVGVEYCHKEDGDRQTIATNGSEKNDTNTNDQQRIIDV